MCCYIQELKTLICVYHTNQEKMSGSRSELMLPCAAALMEAAQTETRSRETKEIIADEGETRLIQIRKSAGVQRDNDEIIRGCWRCNPYLLVTCVLCDSAGHVMGENSCLRKETCSKCMEEASTWGRDTCILR